MIDKSDYLLPGNSFWDHIRSYNAWILLLEHKEVALNSLSVPVGIWRKESSGWQKKANS